MITWIYNQRKYTNPTVNISINKNGVRFSVPNEILKVLGKSIIVGLEDDKMYFKAAEKGFTVKESTWRSYWCVAPSFDYKPWLGEHEMTLEGDMYFITR